MQNTVKDFIENLLAPSAEFSAMPFWFINDRLDENEIKSQISDFKSKGIDGFVFHPRIGIPDDMEYLSDEFMKYVKIAVKAAAANGMYVILYDEGMYPSGSASGKVVQNHPEFLSRGLRIITSPSEGKVLAQLDNGSYLAEVCSGGTIRGIHFGEDDGEPNAPLAADILNPLAVDRFIQLTHERYYEAVGEYFGTTVIGFFTDEPSILGRCGDPAIKPWTAGFDKIIAEHGGSIRDLEGLFTGEENASTAIYHEQILKRECEIFYKKLSDWCAGHNISLMGHPHSSDDIELEQYFQVPGQDLVFRWVSPEQGDTVGMDSVQAKCSADAARYLGRRRNLNECFGVCSRDGVPWYLTGSDIKWFIDYLAVRGVNLFIPHAFYYSIAGKRKDERPPDVGRNNIWWQHYRYFSDYMKRLSWLMTDGVNDAKIMVLCKNRSIPVDGVRQFYQHQVEFNYVPYSALDKAKLSGDCVQLGSNKYRYVFGDNQGLKLPAKSISGYDEVADRVLETAKECPDLRVTSFTKDGIHCFFLVNAGEQTIREDVLIKSDCAILAVDLWNGTTQRVVTQRQGDRLRLDISLGFRESVLLIETDPENCDIMQYAEPTSKQYIDIAFVHSGAESEKLKKYYMAEFDLPQVEQNLYLKVCAEEMAECCVNGHFAGVSFWNEHEFYLTPYLKKGKNRIELFVTGTLANIYSDETIDYGLADKI